MRAGTMNMGGGRGAARARRQAGRLTAGMHSTATGKEQEFMRMGSGGKGPKGDAPLSTASPDQACTRTSCTATMPAPRRIRRSLQRPPPPAPHKHGTCGMLTTPARDTPSLWVAVIAGCNSRLRRAHAPRQVDGREAGDRGHRIDRRHVELLLPRAVRCEHRLVLRCLVCPTAGAAGAGPAVAAAGACPAATAVMLLRRPNVVAEVELAQQLEPAQRLQLPKRHERAVGDAEAGELRQVGHHAQVGRPQTLVGRREAQLLQARQPRQLRQPAVRDRRAAQVQERDGRQELKAARQLAVVDREVLVEVEADEVGQRRHQRRERVAAHVGAVAQRERLELRQRGQLRHARVAQLLMVKVQLTQCRDARQVGQALVTNACVAQPQRHQPQPRQRQQALVSHTAAREAELSKRRVALQRFKRAARQLATALERQRPQPPQLGQRRQPVVGHAAALVQVEAGEARHGRNACKALVRDPWATRVVAERQRLQTQPRTRDDVQRAVADVGAVRQLQALEVGKAQHQHLCATFRCAVRTSAVPRTGPKLRRCMRHMPRVSCIDVAWRGMAWQSTAWQSTARENR
eukprot:240341-Chlamydomonas_euryale.AAC.9